MRSFLKPFCFAFLCFFLMLSHVESKNWEKQPLSDDEYTVLKVCEGVFQLFKKFPDSIWPGYNLAERPFIVYVQGKWALLFNTNQKIEGFTSCPEGWPDLGTNVLFHQGQYKDLVGQLLFNFQVGDIKTVAIGFPQKLPESLKLLEARMFGHIVHEAFHQFQHDNFGEISWEREERYPILDRENTTLAYLEMSLLMDAIKSAYVNNKEQVKDYIKQFVAVRNFRWGQSDPFVTRYEQGQEIREGTARYVEMKCMELVKTLEYKSSLKGLTSSLEDDLKSISILEYLMKDFQERITEGSVTPGNMLRNRIYPVGSTMGFLADYLNINWKEEAQKAGPEFTFEQLFSQSLGLDKEELSDLLNKAKKKYGYDKILASTKELITEYRNGYKKDLKSFEAQKGLRIEIEFAYRGLSRSRSSTGKMWVMDNGAISFCKKFRVYTLKNEDLILQVHDAAVFEENEWDKKRKKVVFFMPEISSLSLDNKPFKVDEDFHRGFNNIEFVGKNLKFSYSKAGTITFSKNSLKVSLIKKGSRLNI